MKSDFVKIRKKFYVDGEKKPGLYKMPGEKEKGEKYEKNHNGFYAYASGNCRLWSRWNNS